MISLNYKIFLLALFSIIFFLSGCAVLKVDVDVYKGPLANHVDVQTERMAAMAIGARPLLLDLRNVLLEKDCPKQFPFKEKDSVISDAMFEIKGCTPTSSTVRVNAILSLYEDQAITEIEKLSIELQEAMSQLQKAYKNYKDSPGKDYPDRWKSLPQESALYDNKFKCKEAKDLGNKFFVSKVQSKAMGSAKSLLNDLCEGYKNLFEVSRVGGSNNWSWKIKIPKTHSSLLILKMKNGQTSPLKGLESAFLKYGSSKILSESATTGFYTLENRDLVKAHAKLFFPEQSDTEKRNVFVNEVTRIAGGFNNSAEQTNRLMRLALKGIVGLDSGKQLSNVKLVAAIDIVISTVSTNRLKKVLEYIKEQESEIKSSFILKNLIFLKDQYDENKRSGITDPKENLRRALSQNPVEISMSLLTANRYFKDGVPEVAKNSPYSLEVARRFGLTAGPKVIEYKAKDDANDENNEELNIQSIAEDQKAFIEGQLGLEKGRLGGGLFKLVDEYLRSKERVDGSCLPKDCPELERLVRVLVRFSEKVLFIANNSQLLKSDLTTNIEIDNSLESARTDSVIKPVDLNQYTLVLQAIGNSILNQADEFHHQTSYNEKIKDRTAIETLALKSTLGHDPFVFFSQEMSSLQTKRDDASNESNLATEKAILAKAKKDIAQKNLDQINTEIKKSQGEYDAAINDLEIRKKELEPYDDTAVILRETTVYTALAGAEEIEKLLERIKNKNLTINRSDLMKAIITWTNAQHVNYKDAVNTDDQARKLRLKNAYTLLQKIGNNADAGFSGSDAIDTNKQYTNFKDFFEKKHNSAKASLENQNLVIKILKTTLDEKKSQGKAADDNFKQVSLNTSKLETESAQLKELQSTTSEILNKLVEAWATVSTNIRHTQQKTIEEVKGLLRTELKKSDPDLKSKAASALNKIITPETANIYAEAGAKNSKEVLDLLVATLSHQHINAIRVYGPTHDITLRYNEALETARRYRSQLVYIRPSSSYLKSSYPSTSLQNDAGLNWENMLRKHNNRSLINWDVENQGKTRKALNEIVGDIDKQFWQNINSVRVAGGGSTNYVLAKDDIGNWYVKAYSSDTKEIIKTASKLAMFNLGASMKSDLLGRFTSQNEADQNNAVNNSQKTVLEKVFEKHKARYSESTTDTYLTMISERDSETLKANILNSWDSQEDSAKLIDVLKPVLEGNSASLKDTLSKTLKGDTEKTSDKGVEITIALSDIRRFHNALSSDIRNLNLKKTPAEEVTLSKKNKEEAEAALEKAKKELVDKEQDHNHKKSLVNTWEETYAEKSKAIDEASINNLSEIKNQLDEAKKSLDEAAIELKTAQENTTATEAKLKDDEESYNDAVKTLESTEKGENFALSEMTRKTRDMISKALLQRTSAVDDYMRSITFIGEASSE